MESSASNKNIEISLEEDGSFVVKESTTLSAIVAAFFYFLFLYGLVNTDLISDMQSPVYQKMLLFALVPAILFSRKASSKRIYIRVNQEGIYINQFFLTSWANFIAAEYTQEEKIGSIEDNFVLIINYYREGLGHYIKKVPLTNTQDKSEEEVIAAIRHFYDLSKNKT